MPTPLHRGLRVSIRRVSIFSRVLALFTLVFIARSTATSAVPAAPEWHTFTNDGGASIKAQIANVYGNNVNLKREDGKIFNTNISIFSKDDQTFIRVWAAKDAMAHGIGAFSFHAVPVKFDAVSTTDPTTHMTAASWKENYRVEVKNLSPLNWPSLHFQYIIFRQRSGDPSPVPNTRNDGMKGTAPRNITGTFDMDKFSKDEDKTFTLDSIEMQGSSTSTYSYGRMITSSSNTPASGLKGLWIRVYDDDRNLLQEWASDPDIIKTEHWSFPKAAHLPHAPGHSSAPAPPQNTPAPEAASTSLPAPPDTSAPELRSSE